MSGCASTTTRLVETSAIPFGFLGTPSHGLTQSEAEFGFQGRSRFVRARPAKPADHMRTKALRRRFNAVAWVKECRRDMGTRFTGMYRDAEGAERAAGTFTTRRDAHRRPGTTPDTARPRVIGCAVERAVERAVQRDLHAGCDLSCSGSLDQPCLADVLLEVADDGNI